MPEDLLVEFSGVPPDALEVLAAEHPDEIVLVRSRGLGASEYTAQALIALAALRLVVPVVRAHIEAKQQVRFKFKGQQLDIELQAVDEDKIVEALEKALESVSDLRE